MATDGSIPDEVTLASASLAAAHSHGRASECSERLLNRLLHLVEQVTQPPWERDTVMLPSALYPQNPATNHQFTGQNRMMLLAELWDRNLSDPRFLTFRQALQLGKDLGKDIAVRKGERAITLLRPCRIGGPVSDRASDDMTLGDLADLGMSGAGQGDETVRVYLTAYSVFHASQISHMPPHQGSVRAVRSDGAERIDAFMAASGIRVQPCVALSAPTYDAATDCVDVPPVEQASCREAHYSDVLRAWYHATAGECRENRCVSSIAEGELDPVEALRADVFVTIGMTLAGMQPYLERRTPQSLAGWRATMGDPFVRKQLAAATLEVMPMLDGLNAHLAGHAPELVWWGKPATELTAKEAARAEGEEVSEAPSPETNVVHLVPRLR